MNENITDVNKIILSNLSEDEINQLPASVIIDNIRSRDDLQNLSNEDKIEECISFIQDPQNNFSNYGDEIERENVLSSIFHCCKNAKNIYEKLSAEQIIGFHEMIRNNVISSDSAGFPLDVFRTMTEHIDNGSHLEDKILEIVNVINNDSSLPLDLVSKFLDILPKLKTLHEKNKFNLDVNDIFDKISLEKITEHNYLLGRTDFESFLGSELIDKILNFCHNSEENGFHIIIPNLLKKYIDKFGYDAGMGILLKFVYKINNQKNIPDNVVGNFFWTVENKSNTMWGTNYFDFINKVYEEISIDKLFQYKNIINFPFIFNHLSQEKNNKILEVFHDNKEHNDIFARHTVYWNKYVDKFGKEALKEKFLEITNDINNGNIDRIATRNFFIHLHYSNEKIQTLSNKEIEFKENEIKEIVNQISVDKIVQYDISRAIEYLDEEKFEKLIDFCHDSKNFDFLFKSEKLLSNYINKFANEPNEIENLLSYAKFNRLNNNIIFCSSIKNNIFNLSPDKIFEIFSDTNEIKNAILSNSDKINENNKSNIAPLLEKYVEKRNLSNKNKEITSAFIDSFKNAPPSPEQIFPQLKNFFEFVDHPIQEIQQDRQTIKPIDKTKTKSIFSFKNRNKQEPKQEQQEK